MDQTVQGSERARSIAVQIRGDGLECEKIVSGEDDVRTFLGKNAEKIPPVCEMLNRLKKYDILD